jgi:endoglucanase Acf2
MNACIHTLTSSCAGMAVASEVRTKGCPSECAGVVRASILLGKYSVEVGIELKVAFNVEVAVALETTMCKLPHHQHHLLASTAVATAVSADQDRLLVARMFAYLCMR